MKEKRIVVDCCSLLAQHCLQNNHEFDFKDVKIIDRGPSGQAEWEFAKIAIWARVSFTVGDLFTQTNWITFTT